MDWAVPWTMVGGAEVEIQEGQPSPDPESQEKPLQLLLLQVILQCRQFLSLYCVAAVGTGPGVGLVRGGLDTVLRGPHTANRGSKGYNMTCHCCCDRIGDDT